MLIATGKLHEGSLGGQVVIVTGAGGGIGLETARSLLWLGASVVVAELDEVKGAYALELLEREFGEERILFVPTDVSREDSVAALKQTVLKEFGRVDAIINNATFPPTGAVKDVSIALWDRSYAVNLRGPVLMVRTFLSEMLDRRSGTIIFVSSSGAAPYLGVYETFKTAQVELSNVLAAELENTGVTTFTIGPGIVKTETADNAIHQVAPLYGMTVEQFYEMNADKLISVEAAGAGMAAAVALASQYNGTEIGCMQALIDAGIDLTRDSPEAADFRGEDVQSITQAVGAVRHTLGEQAEGWYKRNIFERQWIMRDFKKHMNSSPDMVLQQLDTLMVELSGDGLLLPRRVTAYVRYWRSTTSTSLTS
jgi:NAD(P)-dependent dehydrogenase (short-subunit alcohol dehydrogenase family)